MQLLNDPDAEDNEPDLEGAAKVPPEAAPSEVLPPSVELVKAEDMRSWDFASWMECAEHLIASHAVSGV